MKHYASLSIATAVAVAVVLGIASAAGAHTAGGGGNIATAPTIPLNSTIQGYFGTDRQNFDYYNNAEFYKVYFSAGDHVEVRAQSAGDTTPCFNFYLPGTDDFNFDPYKVVQLSYENTNTNHFEGRFIAGVTGTYVIAADDDHHPDSNQQCDGSGQWAYSFSVEAPHGLHLALPAGYLAIGTNHLSVTVRDALNIPVNNSTLTVGLALQWPQTKPHQIARAHVNNGTASFTFKIPKSREGSKVVIYAGAGDNISWVSTVARRVFRVS